LFLADLIQRLRSREREREQKKTNQNSPRLRKTEDRDPPLALRYDAPPFVVPGEAGSSGQGSNEHLSPHRQQLGQRLYPRVRALYPVSLVHTYELFIGMKCFIILLVFILEYDIFLILIVNFLNYVTI